MGLESRGLLPPSFGKGKSAITLSLHFFVSFRFRGETGGFFNSILILAPFLRLFFFFFSSFFPSSRFLPSLEMLRGSLEKINGQFCGVSPIWISISFFLDRENERRNNNLNFPRLVQRVKSVIWAWKIKRGLADESSFPLIVRFTFDRERVSQIFAIALKKVSGKQRDLYSTLMFPANLLNLILNLVYVHVYTERRVENAPRIIPATFPEQ